MSQSVLRGWGVVCACLCLALASPQAAAAIIYVDAANASGNEDGTQANPFNTIREAITAANTGDTVQVAAGTYRESISMKDGVSVIGAGASSTTIDGSAQTNSVVRFDETKFNPRLSGFTIRGGRGEILEDQGANTINVGGGIWIIECSPLITNNIIEENLVSQGFARGAGIYISNISETPTIQDNIIRNNTASSPLPGDPSQGGGIYINNKSASALVNDNIIESNRAKEGGGIYSRNTATSFNAIQRNQIRDNSAEQGAAIYAVEFDGSNSIIVNNLMTGNGSSLGTRDCDDGSSLISPDQPEICNDGLDNDCNPTTPDIFDGDGDGFLCNAECLDDNPAANPDAAEKCDDGIDNDCDGQVDGDDDDCACVDSDGDGYACADCVDGDVDINPGQPEICNDGIDNDCNPATPDVFDVDGDGFNCAIDCDDDNSLINPGVSEVGCDGIDNDCNAQTDDVVDGDGDGFACDLDCDDNALGINPDAIEFCFDDLDNNCDGQVDAQDDECSCDSPTDLDADGFRCLDCNDGNPLVNPGSQEVCADGIDNDCNPLTPDIFDSDGDGFNCVLDCGPTDPNVNPNGIERCDDGVDNDCDGAVDGDDADCACADGDSDGYACLDCNDSNPNMNPGLQEVCNDGLDNDCNPATPDIFDVDQDGADCTVDCDDNNPITFPGGGENCADLRDNDCDGLIDTVTPALQLTGFGRPMLYLPNTSDPGIGTTWVDPLFNDETWLVGVFGVGYEATTGGAQDLLASTVLPQTQSLFIRVRFSIPDVNGVNSLSIGADYDDAWVAWVNGVEVYRSPEVPAGPLDWDTTVGLHESSNGVVPDFGTLIDISSAIPSLNDGTNVLAIAVYNAPLPSTDLVMVPQLVANYGADDPDCACPDNDGDDYACSDCDDDNNLINPGMIEIGCDFADNDCNPSTSDITDFDQDGFDCASDCDDTDPNRNPGIVEVPCNIIDDDCNSSTFDDADADGDGFDCFEDCDDTNGNISPFVSEIPCNGIDDDCKVGTPDVSDEDGDGAFCDTDCVVDNPLIFPGAAERCDDGIDNDCDGFTDGADDDCACPDVDLDGYNCDDCNDGSNLISPEAIERCSDGIDNDCNPATPDIADADQDGFDCTLDCDDTNSFTRPGGIEICNDGIDNDCDPLTPDIFDADMDGENCDTDCDDGNPNISSSQIEICNDGIDNDCDPATPDVSDADGDTFDCTFDCDDTVGTINPGVAEVCNDGIDNDCNAATPDIFDADQDGFDCTADCNDANAAEAPGLAEQCADGLDNDCDTLVDGDDPDCACPDTDGDNYACADCNDSLPNVNPGQVEVCNDGLDNDCNPATTDLGDNDQDGFSCANDCDDNDPRRNPGNVEIGCDGIDNDCRLTQTPDAQDGDGDGFACDVDCNDEVFEINPGAQEIGCDGIDNDCNGATSDLGDSDADGSQCADDTIKGGAVRIELNGTSTVSIVNNTIVSNRVDNGTGGGIFIDGVLGTGGSLIANNVVSGNTAALGGGVDTTRFFGDLKSNLFFNNTAPDIYNAGAGAGSEEGTLLDDPRFTAPGLGNYRPKAGSPLIDAADPTVAPLQDLERFPRPFDGDDDAVAVSDIGAFEFPSGEVLNLFFSGTNELTWNSIPSDAAYNLYRGDFTRLRNLGLYTQNPTVAGAEQFCDIAPGALPFSDVYEPIPGDLVFYLVTLRGATFEGTLGVDSIGVTRSNTRPCD